MDFKVPPVDIPDPVTPEEKAEMLAKAESVLYPMLPDYMHKCVKHISWNPQGLFYFQSMARLRIELLKEKTNWKDFVEESKELKPMEFAAKCLYDPYTRFLLEDVPGFKEWLVEVGAVKDKGLKLLFDHRLISDDKDEWDAVVAEIKSLQSLT